MTFKKKSLKLCTKGIKLHEEAGWEDIHCCGIHVGCDEDTNWCSPCEGQREQICERTESLQCVLVLTFINTSLETIKNALMEELKRLQILV